MPPSTVDKRFVVDDRLNGEAKAESSTSQAGRETVLEHPQHERAVTDEKPHTDDGDSGDEGQESDYEGHELGHGMFAEGFSGPSDKIVKPLTTEDLAKFKAAQEKTGVVYISRIPPGMRPTKVRHLMSAYGEVGRVYLQPEGMFPYLQVARSP